jgi:hypothetical protein
MFSDAAANYVTVSLQNIRNIIKLCMITLKEISTAWLSPFTEYTDVVLLQF